MGTDIKDQAQVHAEEERSSFIKYKVPELPLAETVRLLHLAVGRFGSIDALVRVLFAQVQEVTHASFVVARFDGQEIPYGRAGMVAAKAGSTCCPSVYHASRLPPFELICRMWESG